MSSLLDVPRWVLDAPAGKTDFRRAVHCVLHAIAVDSRLRELLCMKGGILMALQYHSPRTTTDIDFSTPSGYDKASEVEVIERLKAGIAAASEQLGYDIDCRLQRYEVQPKRADRTFVNIEMSIGFAAKGTKNHQRLISGTAIGPVVNIDYSYRESIPEIEAIEIGEDETICVYGLSTLVAEKFRALLQQPIRNRTRRQDVYDLDYLLRERPELRAAKLMESVLSDLSVKCADRGVFADIDALNNPKVRELAAKDFGTLADELPDGGLPDFDSAFDRVLSYYRSLPWKR